jgi:hypothetical protein
MRPLVPEDIAADPVREHRSLLRAITAEVIASRNRSQSAEAILRRIWPDDRRAAVILKAPSPPASSTSASALQVTPLALLVLLAPQSSALRLFGAQVELNLGRNASVRFPSVAVPPAAAFCAELSSGPVVQIGFEGTTIGPVKKIMLIAAVSEEVARGNPQGAVDIIGHVLASSAARALDSVAFDALPGDAIRPAGLLHNVTPIAAANPSTTLVEAIAADLGALAAAMISANIDPEDFVLVCAPRQAVTLRLLAGMRFAYEVYSSTGLADGSIAAFARGSVAATFENAPSIEVSQQAMVQFQDTPQPWPTGPTASTFQTNLLAIRLRQRGTWGVVAPGGVQTIAGVHW